MQPPPTPPTPSGIRNPGRRFRNRTTRSLLTLLAVYAIMFLVAVIVSLFIVVPSRDAGLPLTILSIAGLVVLGVVEDVQHRAELVPGPVEHDAALPPARDVKCRHRGPPSTCWYRPADAGGSWLVRRGC